MQNYELHCVLLLRLTRLAFPGEPQHSAVVSVSEQVGEAEVAPVFLRVQTQQFLRTDEQRKQRVLCILFSHHLKGHRQTD